MLSREFTSPRLSDPRPLLYLAPNRWHGTRQRTQHLAAGLAQTRPVVFVEPAAYSLAGALRRRLEGERLPPWWAQVTQVSSNLVMFTPSATLPWSLHLRSVNRLIHRFAWYQLRHLVPQVTPPGVDVVVGWPPAVDLARLLKPRRLVYDCLDLFPEFQGGRRARLMKTLESELAQTAWAVVVTSRRLERRWAARHPRVTRIPNGVELAQFLPPRDPWPLPADLAAIAGPRLGYIGTVAPWLDLPLLVQLARQRPKASIVLIGPLERGVTRPDAPPNIHFLGERAYATLPAYLAGMDALLIPFRLTELTHAVNPIKLYEYCASGKPIAATPLDEVVATGGLCHLGEGPRGFLAAVDAALAEAAHADPSRIAARQAFAQASSWDSRVADFTSLLNRPD